MFVSLWDEFVLFSYQKIRLQYDKDTHRPTFRYVYTLSGFLLFLQKQRKPFGKWVVPLAILSKILLFDNSGMMAWSKELKYHQKRKHIKKKCYLIMRQCKKVMRHGVEFFLWCLVCFQGQREFVGIEPPKAKHDVTKLDLTIPLPYFLCIDIDLSIQPMFLRSKMSTVNLIRGTEFCFQCKNLVFS